VILIVQGVQKPVISIRRSRWHDGIEVEHEHEHDHGGSGIKIGVPVSQLRLMQRQASRDLAGSHVRGLRPPMFSLDRAVAELHGGSSAPGTAASTTLPPWLTLSSTRSIGACLLPALARHARAPCSAVHRWTLY